MNTLEYPRQTKPRCRPPIREAVTYNNNNNNMSLKSNLPKTNYKDSLDSDVYTDWDNSHSDRNSTDSESSTSNTSKRLSPLKDLSHADNPKAREDNETSSFFSYFIKSALFTLVSILVVYYLYSSPICFHILRNNHNNRLTEDVYKNRREVIKDFRKSIGDIRLKFKNQKYNIWHVFASQIEEVINEPTQISVIILLGNDTNTIACLAHLLGRISSKALGNNNYLTLNSRNIGNDHGEIIDKLKAELRVDRVVIIEDLLTINSEAVRVLHNLCDKEQPLVSNTVYIITIISGDYEGSNEDTFVEDRLTVQFSKAINLDTLNPLITRIMDGPIISVSPESSMKESKTIEECLLF